MVSKKINTDQPKRIGFCAKCANAIVVRSPIKKGGPTYDRLAGCKLTDDPQNGRNCPLIKED